MEQLKNYPRLYFSLLLFFLVNFWLQAPQLKPEGCKSNLIVTDKSIESMRKENTINKERGNVRSFILSKDRSGIPLRSISYSHATCLRAPKFSKNLQHGRRTEISCLPRCAKVLKYFRQQRTSLAWSFTLLILYFKTVKEVFRRISLYP